MLRETLSRVPPAPGWTRRNPGARRKRTARAPSGHLPRKDTRGRATGFPGLCRSAGAATATSTANGVAPRRAARQQYSAEVATRVHASLVRVGGRGARRRQLVPAGELSAGTYHARRAGRGHCARTRSLGAGDSPPPVPEGRGDEVKRPSCERWAAGYGDHGAQGGARGQDVFVRTGEMKGGGTRKNGGKRVSRGCRMHRHGAMRGRGGGGPSAWRPKPDPRRPRERRATRGMPSPWRCMPVFKNLPEVWGEFVTWGRGWGGRIGKRDSECRGGKTLPREQRESPPPLPVSSSLVGT